MVCCYSFSDIRFDGFGDRRDLKVAFKQFSALFVNIFVFDYLLAFRCWGEYSRNVVHLD